MTFMSVRANSLGRKRNGTGGRRDDKTLVIEIWRRRDMWIFIRERELLVKIWECGRSLGINIYATLIYGARGSEADPFLRDRDDSVAYSGIGPIK
jgi:hypothetical protein